MTIATNSGGRQRTSRDGLPQATYVAALAARAATWFRDEEARFGDLLTTKVDHNGNRRGSILTDML